MNYKDQYEAELLKVKEMYQDYYDIHMQIIDLKEALKTKKAKIDKKTEVRDQLYLNLCRMLLTSRKIIESQRSLIESNNNTKPEQ